MFPYEIRYNSATTPNPQPPVSLSQVSVVWGQHWSKNTSWRTPEVNNSEALNMAVVWVRWGNLRSSAPPAPQVRLVRSPAGRPLVPQQRSLVRVRGCWAVTWPRFTEPWPSEVPDRTALAGRGRDTSDPGGVTLATGMPGEKPQRLLWAEELKEERKRWPVEPAVGCGEKLVSCKQWLSDWGAGLAPLPLLRGPEFRPSRWQGPS